MSKLVEDQTCKSDKTRYSSNENSVENNWIVEVAKF